MGCGKDLKKRYINVDYKPHKGVDLVFNIEDNWPLKDNIADFILFDNVLEHLSDPLKALKEAYRVCKSNAKIKIIVPHFKSPGAARPDHKTIWSKTSLNPWLMSREEKSGGLEGESLFELLNLKVTHRHPFAWHQRKYLGREIIAYAPHNLIFFLKIKK